MRPLLLSLVLAAAPAWSQTGGPPADCAGDAAKLCAGARAQGRDAMRSCMRARKDELSDACRRSLRQRRSDGDKSAAQEGADPAAAGKPETAERSGPPPACKDDLRKACADAAGKGPDAARACLKRNLKDLGADCRSAIAQAREAKLDASAAQGPAEDADGFKAAVRRIADACVNEKGLFCNDVEPKGGALMRCLMEHRDDATRDCGGALDAAKPYAMRRKAAAKPGGGQ